MNNLPPSNPLRHVDEWDDYVASRYQEGKAASDFRKYDPQAHP